jgi:hypothetical protein
LRGVPQRFRIDLSGVGYMLTFQYRDADDGGWVLDIGDPDDVPLVCGIPLVPGEDLLAQYATLGFRGEMWVRSDGTPDAVPTFAGLGTTSHVYWIGP